MSQGFSPFDVVVAGAGISGLTCALALTRAGLNVAVIEASGDPGGCIKSARRSECVADGGPQTFSPTPEFMDLIESLECHSLLERASESSRAMYIFSRGRLVPAPTTPSKFLASPLLSPSDKLRVLGEPFVGARKDGAEETVTEFAARRGGRGIVDALVRPMVRGIFAGDPDRLSLRSAFPRLAEYEERHSSVFVGALSRRRTAGPRRPAPVAFRGGNIALPAAMAAALNSEMRFDAPVTDMILRGANIELFYEGSRPGSVVAKHAVLALPAYESAKLLFRLEPRAAAALRAIRYVPMAQIALSYPKSALAAPLHGFGFLNGGHSGLRMLGCAWNSAMFADRCPPDCVLLTAFLGGDSEPTVLEKGDDELVRDAHRDLSHAMGIGDAAPDVIAGFRFDRAIPQYELGHADRLQTVADGMARLSNVSLAGNYFGGPAIGDCIAGASATARAVIERLAATPLEEGTLVESNN